MVRMLFDSDQQDRSARGTALLQANDEKIGEGRIERTVAVRFSAYAGMDVGRDNGLPVDRARRGQITLPLHRNGQEGGLRPQTGQPRGGKGAARGQPRTSVAAAHGISA